MRYNLTNKQKDTARVIVKAVRDGKIEETFNVRMIRQNSELSLGLYRRLGSEKLGTAISCPGDDGTIDVLKQQNLLVTKQQPGEHFLQCTVTGGLFEAVDCEFKDDEQTAPLSTIAQPHPPEILIPLDRLHAKYPDPKRLGFLVMRFTAAKPFERIVKTIKDTASKYGLHVVRADEHEFHSDLWGNVRTFLHGCGFGIAVYERIETDEPNANVGLEVGYLMAMNKPVLLLKDKTLDTTQTDLAGKLYKPFDPHDPEGTIPALLERWFADYGITVPGSMAADVWTAQELTALLRKQTPES